MLFTYVANRRSRAQLTLARRFRLRSWVSQPLVFTLCLGLLAMLPHYSEAKDCRGTVLLLGDSIGAGYGLAKGESWADMLGQELQDTGLHWVNASISGETTAGGLRRLDDLLTQHSPNWIIIELGGNDGLRGYPVKRMQTNLLSMVKKANDAGAKAYLLGMRIPPNYGPLYTKRFHDSYHFVAAETDSTYLPFLLEGIGENMNLMQRDGIHPRAEAQPIILNTAKSAMPDFCASQSDD